MKQQTHKIAIGGIVSALSLVVMLLSAVFPFAEYTCPALAGILLIALVLEFNKRTAFLAFVAIGVLALFIVPNKEAVALFIGFLGYYPILKSKLEQPKSRVLEWVLKVGIFNIAVLISYFVVIYLFGMTQVLDDMQQFAQYGVLILLGLANVAFVVYDFALTQLIALYLQRIKPKFKKVL